MQTLLDEEVLVVIGEKLKLNPRFLEQGVLCETRAGVIVCGVKAVLAQAGLPKCLEDPRQQKTSLRL